MYTRNGAAASCVVALFCAIFAWSELELKCKKSHIKSIKCIAILRYRARGDKKYTLCTGIIYNELVPSGKKLWSDLDYTFAIILYIYFPKNFALFKVHFLMENCLFLLIFQNF